MTFRLIGEGTGNARDIDQYDNHYEHIIAWNTESKEIVGAYRLGRLDKILSSVKFNLTLLPQNLYDKNKTCCLRFSYDILFSLKFSGKSIIILYLYNDKI